MGKDDKLPMRLQRTNYAAEQMAAYGQKLQSKLHWKSWSAAVFVE